MELEGGLFVMYNMINFLNVKKLLLIVWLCSYINFFLNIYILQDVIRIFLCIAV